MEEGECVQYHNGLGSCSKKLHQRVHRFFRSLFHEPVPRPRKHDHSHVERHELHLLPKYRTQRFLTADRQYGHRQPVLRELRKVPGCPVEGGKIRPSGLYTPRPGIGGYVGFAVLFRDRASTVGGEIVPIIVKIDAFPAMDQLFRRRSVEPKMPKLRIVIDGLPLVHAWKESIHDDELLYLLGKLGGVCVSDHQSDVMAYNTCFFYA